MSETALILNELPHNTAEPSLEPITPRAMRPFSGDYARQMAAKSHEARRLRKAKDERAEQRAQIAALEEEPAYDKLRLIRVRKALDELDKQMAQAIKAGESKVVKELADAQAKLSDQERILDGRPLPGSRRPRPEKPTKDTSTVEPVD